jgi:hypothetical protein
MIKNKEENDPKMEVIEKIARNFANKRPKETNFDNTKTRKYFGNKFLKEDDSNCNTIIDSLLANKIGSSISTNNKTDSITSCILN